MGDDFKSELGRLESAGRAAWPAFDVPADALQSHLAKHLEATEGVELDGPALYLTCGCALGHDAALTALESRYFPALDGALASFSNISGLADEVKQRLRKKLYVSEGDKPARISAYSGRGSLERWLKVAASREAISLLRTTGREVVNDEALAGLVAQEDDQELAYLKTVYRKEFKSSFQEAFEELTDRQRTIIGYQVVQGLNIDAIGAVYGVHRATVARWIEKIRAELLSQTQKILMQRIRVEPAELDSILRLIQSQMDVSLHRLLDGESSE